MSAIESPSSAKRGIQLVQTDYYGLGGCDSLVQSAFFTWDAALVATITIWATNYKEVDVALSSAVAREWCQLNPPTGYTAISPAGAATIAAGPLVVVVPGGTAGCCWMDLGNIGGKRLRARIVCTVQGQIEIIANGKD